MTPSALGTDSTGTRRMTVAVPNDQKPPMTMPRRARATISTAKFGAMAMMTSDESINPVIPMSTWRRLKRPASVAMNKLVATAKRPEIEIAWPAIPSVARRSWAMGVNKLTGINSEAISSDTQSAMEPTALQVCFGDKSDCVVMVAMQIFRLILLVNSISEHSTVFSDVRWLGGMGRNQWRNRPRKSRE